MHVPPRRLHATWRTCVHCDPRLGPLLPPQPSTAPKVATKKPASPARTAIVCFIERHDRRKPPPAPDCAIIDIGDINDIFAADPPRLHFFHDGRRIDW